MTRGRRRGGDDYRIAMQARIGRPRRVPQLTPNAVGNHVAEFHGAAGREVLAAFEESSEDKHRKADYDSTPPITESDHPAGMTPSGKQPKCCSLSQMSRRLIATMRGDAAGAREPIDNAADQHGPEDREQGCSARKDSRKSPALSSRCRARLVWNPTPRSLSI